MKLLIIRHGTAEKSEGGEDARRRLTGQGRKRIRREARALVRGVPNIDCLATSPLVRAVETGQIIADEYAGLLPTVIAPLLPGKTPADLLHWLQKQPPDSTVALVGHEPALGVFISWMLTGLSESFVILKKGGACLLELPEEVRAGRARLSWFAKPSQLRKLK